MRPVPLTAVILSAVLAAACSGAEASEPDAPVAPPVAGMCAPEHPDCVDTVFEPIDAEPAPGSDVDIDVDVALAGARALLGAADTDLPAGVRVGRVGDEHWMLTEDYVIGRLTVEMDTDDDGVNRVTSVRVELPDGPQVVTG